MLDLEKRAAIEEPPERSLVVIPRVREHIPISPDRLEKYAAHGEWGWKGAQEKVGGEVAGFLDDLEVLNQREDASVGDYVQMLDRALDFFHGKLEIVYSESPLETGEYLYLMHQVYVPAVESMERSLEGASEEELHEAFQGLEEFVMTVFDDCDYHAPLFLEMSRTMLDLDETEALPLIERGYAHIVKRTSERHAGFVESFGKRGKVESWDGPEYEEGDEGVWNERLDPLVMAYDLLDEDNGFHYKVVELAGEHEWENPQVASQFLSRYLAGESSGCLRAYIKAFENIGVDAAVPALLKNLQSEDTYTRRFSAEVLFGLELGERGVSEGEVEIFGKMFRLVQDKGQRHIVESLTSARRLDSHGRWAAFGSTGEVQGTFAVAEDTLRLRGTDNNVATEILLDVNLQKLFKEACLARVDETPEERAFREGVFKDYLVHFGEVIDGLYDRTGVWLNSLELHEQAFFVHVYKRAVEEGRADNLEAMVHTYGEEALKVYVTMEYGESGEAITRFLSSEEVSEYTKREVLRAFYSISGRAQEWRRVFERAEVRLDHQFSAEVHEAFIRKASEYFRAAMLIERGEGGDVTTGDLLESLNSIGHSLKILRGLYSKDSALILEGNPQVQAECADPECTKLLEEACVTWILRDKLDDSRVVVSVRPEATVAVGDRLGGEARINFRVTNKAEGLETRLGLDISDYGDVVEDLGRPAVVSLDLGTGRPDREAGVWPSERVGRVLGIVEGSEGGHNEASFSPESAEHFTSLANEFTNYMENRYGSVT